MNQEESSTRLDLFVWELLPENEQEEIEKAIRENPDLRDEVARRQLKFEVFKQVERDALIEKMAAWDAEEEQTTPSVKTVELPKLVPIIPQIEPKKREHFVPLRRAIQWAMAASIALLVGFYWLKTNNDAVKISNNLYAILKPMPEDDDKATGSSNGDVSDFEAAEIAFKSNNFEKMIGIYKANLLKKDENTEGSIFEKEIRQYTEWRLALAYLAAKQGKNPEFSTLLKKIIDNSDHLYHKEAVELDKEINNFWWRLVN